MNPNDVQLEVTAMQNYTFDEQFASYQRSGYAIDVSTNEVMGDREMYRREKVMTGKAEKQRAAKPDSKKRKLLDTLADYDSDEEEAAGPWANFESAATTERDQMRKEAADAVVAAGEAKEQSAADKLAAEADVEASILEGSSSRNVHILEPDEEEEMWEKVNERKLTYTLPPRPKRGSQMADATSVFHGAELKDYQGRPWSAAPSNVKPDEDGHACFIPRRCIKKLTGHTKGVQALEYLPGTGHLLLSASMDGKCKVWDAHSSEMQVQRTYTGHTEGVRSIHFNNSGSHFLSSGFDRTIRHWDLETGQAAATFSNRKMGYQVRFHPGNNNVFIAACNDNRLYQWDIRTGTVVQEYNHHLQPCNTVTFIDGGRKFVSTSDDKKILVWETDIPVPIKYIAEPGMHCVPSVSMHPSQQFFAAQSMDNKILTYTCGDKVRQQKKKTYTGHNNTGYACQIGFSPNGQFMCSGDGKGEVHFWDWKSTKCYRKFHAHDNGPCMAAVWHPLHPNRVATCGWDGLIKIWD